MTSRRMERRGGYSKQLHIVKQCCSQGQNPKAKDEAKAWTLEAKTKIKAKAEAEAETEAEAWTHETKTKARTLESKANFKAKYDTQFNANIPHSIDMTIAPIS